MREGKEYIITSDPHSSNQDDWVVILHQQFDKAVVRYKDIRITEKGTKVSFSYDKLYCPETAEVTGNEEKFEEHLSDILVNILREHHDKQANIYYSMKTGERVEY